MFGVNLYLLVNMVELCDTSTWPAHLVLVLLCLVNVMCLGSGLRICSTWPAHFFFLFLYWLGLRFFISLFGRSAETS